jgi:hypothetical protein
MDAMKNRAVTALVDGKIETEKDCFAEQVTECMCTRGTALANARFAVFVNKQAVCSSLGMWIGST